MRSYNVVKMFTDAMLSPGQSHKIWDDNHFVCLMGMRVFCYPYKDLKLLTKYRKVENLGFKIGV